MPLETLSVSGPSAAAGHFTWFDIRLIDWLRTSDVTRCLADGSIRKALTAHAATELVMPTAVSCALPWQRASKEEEGWLKEGC